MMSFTKRIVLAGFLCALAGIVLVGCEVGDDSSEADSDVTGSWLYSNTAGEQSTWALVQDDDGYINGAGTDGETIGGTISASSIYLSLSYSSNVTASLNGTVSDDTMSGTFTNSTSGSGSWTAVKTN